MPGSLSNPVVLDPWQAIVEVGWPGGDFGLMVFRWTPPLLEVLNIQCRLLAPEHSVYVGINPNRIPNGPDLNHYYSDPNLDPIEEAGVFLPSEADLSANYLWYGGFNNGGGGNGSGGGGVGGDDSVFINLTKLKADFPGIGEWRVELRAGWNTADPSNLPEDIELTFTAWRGGTFTLNGTVFANNGGTQIATVPPDSDHPDGWIVSAVHDNNEPLRPLIGVLVYDANSNTASFELA